MNTPKQVTAAQMKAANAMKQSDMVVMHRSDLEQLLLETAEMAYEAGQNNKKPAPRPRPGVKKAASEPMPRGWEF